MADDISVFAKRKTLPNGISMITFPHIDTMETCGDAANFIVYYSNNFIFVVKSDDFPNDAEAETIRMSKQFVNMASMVYEMQARKNLPTFSSTVEIYADNYNKLIEYCKNDLYKFDFGYVGHLFDTGKLDDAERLMSKYIKKKIFVSAAYYNLACIYSLRNSKEASLSYFSSAVRNGETNWIYAVNDDDLKNVRYDPSFVVIIVAMINSRNILNDIDYWKSHKHLTDGLVDYIIKTGIDRRITRDNLIDDTHKDIYDCPEFQKLRYFTIFGYRHTEKHMALDDAHGYTVYHTTNLEDYIEKLLRESEIESEKRANQTYYYDNVAYKGPTCKCYAPIGSPHDKKIPISQWLIQEKEKRDRGEESLLDPSAVVTVL
uniref:Tetratricopeptide repeat protein n=1 Tax=viral metagenome TaxID=1070528 RepID=A0A6C0EC99_9ZZZZ